MAMASQREPAADVQVHDLFQSLGNTLNGITNVDSAKSSVKELGDWTSVAQKVGDTTSSWSEITRKKVNLEIEDFLPVLSRSVDSIKSNDELERVMEEPMNGVMEALHRIVPPK